ncbi:sensor histidine kinase [Cohnella terricola]|uniref:Sensor histidine kinase n=1 Tax=Cohnella terricola TaxID=1289167 RepID=A0A559JT18_9BACL|nr:sensor histidine kinase [Cohnella terricola]TVY03029.1 sensor histidine kinase [Cohnella terricola]
MLSSIKSLIHTIRSRLFYKILIINTLLALIPLVIVSTTYYYRSNQLLEKHAAEEAQQKLTKTANRIDDLLYAVKNQMIRFGEQDIVHHLVMAESESAVPDSGRNALTELLQAELTGARLSLDGVIDNIYLLSGSGQLYGTEAERGLQYPEAFRIMPFQFDRVPECAFFTDYNRMACIMKLFHEGDSNAGRNSFGRLVFTLDVQKVSSLYGDFLKDTFYIITADNLILSASDRNAIGKLLDIRAAGERFVIQQKSRYTEFQYISLVTPSAGPVIRQQAIFSAKVTLFAWISIVIVTYFVLKKITIPIQRLTRLMRSVEREDYKLIGGITSTDEIALLCQGYNRLVERTSELIEKNYKSELMFREAELKAIRMHINPHFLYNTMEYISIMSQTPDKARYIPDIVYKLSSIFRFSITPGNVLVPLEMELSFVEKYLVIHQFRYGDRMRYVIDMSDLVRNMSVPKLILQPLVENAVIHGIDQLPEGGMIRISAREEDYCLVIEIVNDSPNERAGADENGAAERKGKKGLGSGMDNVKARIRHHYGSGYGVRLERLEGERKVKVQVVLPMELMDAGEDREAFQ